MTAVALWAAIPGAAAQTTPASAQNIVETAASAGKFKTLTTLLKRAGLVKALEGKGPLCGLAVGAWPISVREALDPARSATGSRERSLATVPVHVAEPRRGRVGEGCAARGWL